MGSSFWNYFQMAQSSGDGLPDASAVGGILLGAKVARSLEDR